MGNRMNTVKEMRIETNRLIIKPYIEADLLESFQLMQNKEIFRYGSYDFRRI